MLTTAPRRCCSSASIMLLLTTVLGLLLCPARSFYASGSGGVVFESAADFKAQVLESDAPWIVQFFAQFSHESEMLVPEWQKATKALSGIVKVGTVDVVTREDIAAAFGIHVNDEGFPYVRIFRAPDKRKPATVKGPFTAESLVLSAMRAATELALQRVRGEIFEAAPEADDAELLGATTPSHALVTRLNDTNFNQVAAESGALWLLLFEAPGNLCMHCKELQTEFQAAAKQVDGLLGHPRAKGGTAQRTPSASGTRYTENDVVKARWKYGEELYTAKVKRCHENGTFHLTFEDGDVWEDAPAAIIREKVQTAEHQVAQITTIRFGVIDVTQSPALGKECSVALGLIPALRIVTPSADRASGDGTRCVSYEHLAQNSSSSSSSTSSASSSLSSGVNQIGSLEMTSFAMDLLEDHYARANAAAATITSASASAAHMPPPALLRVPVPQLTSTAALESRCGPQSTTSLCLLCALPHILDSGKDGRQRYLDSLRGLMRRLRRERQPVSVLWFQGGDQPKIESVVQLTFGFPAVVAVHLHKRLFATMQGAFSEDAVAGFVHGIINGRQRTTPLQGLMHVADTDEWDGEDGVIERDRKSVV